MHSIPAPHRCRSGAGWPDKHGDGRVHEKMKVPEYRLSVCVLIGMVDRVRGLDAKPRALCCPTQVAALRSGSQSRGILSVSSSVERDLDLEQMHCSLGDLSPRHTDANISGDRGSRCLYLMQRLLH